MSAPISIEDYDPRWPDQFETLRSKIAAALGPIAAAVEHVGSTAVPGLAAKPIIDIDVLLRSAPDLPSAIRSLTSLGYAHEGDLGVAGREAFRPPACDIQHHLYVCPTSEPEYRRHLAFRDHLRSHPEDAKAYAQLKRTLAARCSGREAYTQAKTEFVEHILRLGRESATEHSPRLLRITS